MSRRIIIPKGVVESPDQNNVIEISSRLSRSKGNLIAKRQGKKLVAQQLPDWEDVLSSGQESRNIQSNLIAVKAGCSKAKKDTTRTTEKGNETFQTARTNQRGNETYASQPSSAKTTFYSQDATGGTSYRTAQSGDVTTTTATTCYNSALQRTPSRARVNITGDDLTVESTIESNIQMTDAMVAKILGDTRKNISSPANYAQPKAKKLFQSDDSSEDYILPPPRRLPNQPADESSRCPGSNEFNSECRYSSDPYSGSTESQVYGRLRSPTPPPVRPTNQTVPPAVGRTRTKWSEQTYPLAANEIGPGESPMYAYDTADTGFSGELPDTSYGGFQPPLCSSLGTPPPASNQTFAGPSTGSCPAKQPTPRYGSTRTYNSGDLRTPPMDRTRSTRGAGSCPANQTAARPTHQTFPTRGPSPTGRAASPQTLPKASQRRRRPRPGEDTYPRSANRSRMEAESMHFPCSPPRDFPTDESYELRFQPWHAGTMRSMSEMEDSSGTPWLYEENVTPGKYNVIRPMTPSPGDECVPTCGQTFAQPSAPANQTMARPGDTDCAPSCPGSSANQTFAQPAAATNRTMPRPANQTMARPANQTMPRSANQTCPGSGQKSSSRPTTPQTVPRAARRSGRPRPGEDTFPRSANRSLMDDGGSPCEPCSPPRDFPTDESYELKFQPWHAGTMRSMSEMEDSSGTPWLYEENVTPGKYNVIRPMTPSPPGGAGEECVPTCGQTFAQPSAPANQTMARPGDTDCAPSCPGSSANQTFAQPAAAMNRTMPRPANQTMARPANQTMPRSANQTCPGSGQKSSSRPTTPQTVPRAARRSGRPRPGEDTFPRSANRSLMDDGGSPCEPCSSPRDFPTDESYELRFQPWHAGTMRSMSEMEDSSGTPWLYEENVTPGKYNVIRPMTPSPPGGAGEECVPTCGQGPSSQTFAQPSGPANQTMARPGDTDCAPLCPGSSANQTFAQPAAAMNRTMPRPANQTMARPANQTMPRSANQTCPGSGQESSRRPTTPQTVPRAARRSGRPRPGEDTFPRSANRSLMDDGGSPCEPCSPPRDFPTDESYELRFQPWHAGTMRSMSEMEDSSGTPWLYEENATPGKYNVIESMTPSSPGDCDPSCPESPSSRISSRSPSPRSSPNNQTRSRPGNATFPGGATFARTPSPRSSPLSQTRPQSGGSACPAGQTFASRGPPMSQTYARTPSPKSRSRSPTTCPGPRMDQTFPSRGSPQGQTFARTPSPRGRPFPDLTMATYGSTPRGRPDIGETFEGTCPGAQTFAGGAPEPTSAGSRMPQRSPQTLPKASRRAARPRPGQDTFPRSANRSILEEGQESSCDPCSTGGYSDARDFPTDESYERFEPLSTGTMRSFSMEEDSSEEPLFGFGAPLRRSQEGKYNIITPMTPSPKKDDVDECACEPEEGEQVVSYESRVVEDFYVEQ